jgi:membrane-bound metal-dependent hydrolase YbcI (DUF457 family)
MIIGVAGGLALTTVVQHPDVCAAARLCLKEDYLALARNVGIVGASAFLATWPDIDEPNAFISRRVRWITSIVVGILFALVGSQIPNPFLPDTLPPWSVPLAQAGVGFILGLALVGPIVGQTLLSTIRESAGGHRRLTHSLVIGLPLLLIGAGLWAAGLWWAGIMPWAWLPITIAWGQILHVVGDVVTPSGVPLFWPLVKQDFHALPRALRPVGEPIIAAVMVLVLVLLVFLGGWWR